MEIVNLYGGLLFKLPADSFHSLNLQQINGFAKKIVQSVTAQLAPMMELR